MGRVAGASGARTAAAIRRAGLRLIYRRGFAATSLRDLAAEVGVQPASLYNHIRSKQDLLADLIREHMDALLAHTDAALARAAEGAANRLRAFVAHHMHYHLEHRQEVFVANFELRALEPRHYAAVVAQRRAYEQRLIALLDGGVATGSFALADTHVAAYAILAMLTGACTWFKPEGRLSKSELVGMHAEMVLNACAARPAVRTAATPAAAARAR